MATALAQQAGQAPYPLQQAFHYYPFEYSARLANHGPMSMPASFDIMSAFLKPRLENVVFRVLDEMDHSVSLSSFLNAVTGTLADVPLAEAVNSLPASRILHFQNTDDPLLLTHTTERGYEFVFTGFSLVREGDEVTVFCAGGRRVNVAEEREHLPDSFDGSSSVRGKERIRPHPDHRRDIILVDGTNDFWKFHAAVRFDVAELRRHVRYVMYDIGDSFLVISDDAGPLTDYDGSWLIENAEDYLRIQSERLAPHEALFEGCLSALYLPLMFEEEAHRVETVRVSTPYTEVLGRMSNRRLKPLVPAELRRPYRNISVLPAHLGSVPDAAYSPPDLHVEDRGFWKKLDDNEYGTDRNGIVVRGRTWVHQTMTWAQGTGQSRVVAQGRATPPTGKNPGFLYVMRSPAHPKEVFKVGLTRRSADERAAELSSTSGQPDKLFVMQEWPTGDCVLAERMVHERLASRRLTGSREFFRAEYREIFQIIDEVLGVVDG